MTNMNRAARRKSQKVVEKQAAKMGIEDKINQFQQMIVNMYQKLFGIEQKVNTNGAIARAIDWKTQGIINILEEKGLVTKLEIANKVEEIQIEQFELDSIHDDKERNLLTLDADTVAEDGMTAIMSLKAFKDGEEILDQRIPRSKILLGRAEISQEIDTNLIGMKIGETKEFELKIDELTDKVELTLLGLREPAPQEEPVESEAEKTAQEISK